VVIIRSISLTAIYRNHTIRRTEIHALLDSWVTDTPSVRKLSQKKIGANYLTKHNI